MPRPAKRDARPTEPQAAAIPDAAAQPAPASAARTHRPSAAVVLLRGEGEGLQVFWVRRSERVQTMPEFRGFVGGTVDKEDAEIPVAGATGQDAIERVCAIREAFEEAGVLLATERTGPAAALAHARSQLLAGETTFGALAAEHGWRFHAGPMTPAGRWMTPPFTPRRFETQYFVARMPDGQTASVREGELSQGEWVRPVDALRRWQMGYEIFAAPILYTMFGLAHGEEGIVQLHEAPAAAGAPVRRIELQWGIVLHPMPTRPLPPATHTNAYLVGEPEMVLVDPGSGDPAALEELFGVIDALAQDRRRLKLIVLTHHHPDHVGGLAAVRARYGVKVAAHAETAKHVPVDFTLADGDWVPLVPGVGDWNLQVIHTPGHARGHLCLFHPRTGALLTGDHVTGAGTVIIDPPEGDMGDYLRSLERLLTLPIRTLFPAHGGPQGAAKRRIQGLIDHRLGRERKVLEALAAGSGAASIGALVERVYDDTPRDLWPYAERSLLAHLLKLEAEGKAVREGEQWRRADE
jgi:glyoxylase-like metal-dependent hydrolase (beta-lactamase superfamily II)/8-oxo-dGTP pyrophosphatase MutT (NUDIX family)